MSRLMKVLQSLGETGRRVGRTLLPASEDAVRMNVRRAIEAGEFGVNKRPFGFTFDPVEGRFLEAGDDLGYMMAQVPERVGMNRVPDEDAILRLIDDPYYMNQLRTGDYLGGWLDDSTNEFVVDPSTRFFSRPRSIVRGADARQKAGFDLGAVDEYKLTPELIDQTRRQMDERAGRAALAIMLGLPAGAAGLGGAYAASRD